MNYFHYWLMTAMKGMIKLVAKTKGVKDTLEVLFSKICCGTYCMNSKQLFQVNFINSI